MPVGTVAAATEVTVWAKDRKLNIFVQNSVCNIWPMRIYPAISSWTLFLFSSPPLLSCSFCSRVVLCGRQWWQYHSLSGLCTSPGLRRLQSLLALLVWRLTAPCHHSEEMAYQSRPQAELWCQKWSGERREADVWVRWEATNVDPFPHWNSAKAYGSAQ